MKDQCYPAATHGHLHGAVPEDCSQLCAWCGDAPAEFDVEVALPEESIRELLCMECKNDVLGCDPKALPEPEDEPAFEQLSPEELERCFDRSGCGLPRLI